MNTDLDLIEDCKNGDRVDGSDERAKEESLKEAKRLCSGLKENPRLADTPERNTWVDDAKMV